MEQLPIGPPRVATAADAATVARLLDAFQQEYDAPTPGIAVLTTRLERFIQDLYAETARFVREHPWPAERGAEDQDAAASEDTS